MKWEHKQVKVKTGGMVTPNLDSGAKVLAQHSKDGWELINVVPLPRGGGTIEQVYYFFKKPA